LRERKVSGGFFDLLNLFPVKSMFGVIKLKKMNFKPIIRNGMIITYNIAKIRLIPPKRTWTRAGHRF